MKWYKHISDSLDDPFIQSLMDEFGAEGYRAFFGTLEIYAREFLPEDGWNLACKWMFISRKLRTFPKKLRKIYQFIKQWEVEDHGETVTIFIPKFKQLIDESTLKKLREKEKSFRNDSGTLPKNAPTDRDRDRDKDNTPPISPPTGGTPVLKKGKAKGTSGASFSPPSWIPPETWKAYLDLRDKKRAAKTSYALSLVIQDLEKIQKEHGQDPVAVLNQSIQRGWTGMFPLKEIVDGKAKYQSGKPHGIPWDVWNEMQRSGLTGSNT